MSVPLVSVVIDTHNYGRFIEECIDSVLSQDFPADQMEVVVVDDGSTDDTAERIKKYGSRIRYFYKSNGGQASAFNLGFAKARGEIIALLDADDYWLPGKLGRIVAEFESQPEAGLVYHRLFESDSGTNERKAADFLPISGHLPSDPSAFFKYAPNRSSCLAFRRRFLEHLLPIPGGITLQADGYLGSLIAFISPVVAVAECLGVYRIHGQNLYQPQRDGMSTEQKRRRAKTTEALVSGLGDWLTGHGYETTEPQVRTFLDRWELVRAGERFALEPPGRLRYFAHLSLYNRCYGPYLSRRLRVINRINALGALIVGYKHVHLLEEWRLALVAAVKRAFRADGTKRSRRADALKP